MRDEEQQLHPTYLRAEAESTSKQPGFVARVLV